MSRTTSAQRFRRLQSPYTISVPVKSEFGTTVINLIGVYYEERMVMGKNVETDEDEFQGTEIVEERFDLGTFSNLANASKEAALFREDPEEYYAEFLRKQEAAA